MFSRITSPSFLRENIKGKHIIVGMALALYTASATSQTDDVGLWLKLHAEPLNTANENPNGAFFADFDGPDYRLLEPQAPVNHHAFKEENKKIAKANKRKLHRRLSDQVKINLFSSQGENQKHRYYINSVKKELIGKSQYGNTSYELRVSDEKTEAHLKYNF